MLCAALRTACTRSGWQMDAAKHYPGVLGLHNDPGSICSRTCTLLHAGSRGGLAHSLDLQHIEQQHIEQRHFGPCRAVWIDSWVTGMKHLRGPGAVHITKVQGGAGALVWSRGTRGPGGVHLVPSKPSCFAIGRHCG